MRARARTIGRDGARARAHGTNVLQEVSGNTLRRTRDADGDQGARADAWIVPAHKRARRGVRGPRSVSDSGTVVITSELSCSGQPTTDSLGAAPAACPYSPFGYESTESDKSASGETSESSTVSVPSVYHSSQSESMRSAKVPIGTHASPELDAGGQSSDSAEQSEGHGALSESAKIDSEEPRISSLAGKLCLTWSASDDDVHEAGAARVPGGKAGHERTNSRSDSSSSSSSSTSDSGRFHAFVLRLFDRRESQHRLRAADDLSCPLTPPSLQEIPRTCRLDAN